MNYRDIIVFDFETGSRNPHKTQPTQIAAIALHGRRLTLQPGGVFNSEIRPILDDKKAIEAGFDPIEDEALQITGKNRKDLAKAPSAGEQQQISMGGAGVSNPGGVDPSMIQGNSAAVGMNNAMMQQQMAFNNQSGYPVPPAGYDNMNNPYWIDPVSGQMSYTPPSSGLGLANAMSKGIAWAKWLA